MTRLVRWGQAFWLAVLMLMSVAAVSAAPWYAATATESVAAAGVAAAPALERVLVVTREVNPAREPGPPVPAAVQGVTELLLRFGIRTEDAVSGIQTTVTIQAADGRVDVLFAYRERACENVYIIDGTCPTADGDVLVSTATAERLGVSIRDTIAIHTAVPPRSVTYRLVGIYEPIGLDGTYWTGSGLLRAPASWKQDQRRPPPSDAAFVTESGLMRAGTRTVEVGYHAALPVAAFTDTADGGIDGRLARARTALAQRGYGTSSGVADLADALTSAFLGRRQARTLRFPSASVGARSLAAVEAHDFIGHQFGR